jgi:glycosyltransferase involved in cell wall biosynthesis
MWNEKTVSVVFPAFNEEKNILTAVQAFLSQGCVDEVLVVDNNSTDRTLEIVRGTAARLVCEERQGYGYALRKGLAEANGDYIILCEPDGTFLARDLIKLLAYAEDFELVMGTRTTKELIWDGANMKYALRLGNYVVAKLLEILYNGPSLSDCGCTYRLIRRSAYKKIRDLLTVGSSHFLPDMVIACLKRKIRMIEIPVNYCSRVGRSKITGRLGGVLGTCFCMVGLIIRKRFSVA